MKKQSQLFKFIIFTITIISLLLVSLNFSILTKNQNISTATKEEQIVWYLDLKGIPVKYHIISNNDNSNSLKEQFSECINIIYKSFNKNLNLKQFVNQLNKEYIDPIKLTNFIKSYNKEENIFGIRIEALSNSEANLNSLQKITDNNYPVLIWYTKKTLDKKTYFDGDAYWGYAKPLIIYSIDKDFIYAIDLENGYITINKDTFENNWSKCGNRAIVIG